MSEESTTISDCSQNDKVLLIFGEEKQSNEATTHAATATTSILMKVEDADSISSLQQVKEEEIPPAVLPQPPPLPQEVPPEEDAWSKSKRKSVCDPDYATPSKEGGPTSSSGAGLLLNKSVKRRLDFQSVSIITTTSYQNDHDYCTSEKKKEPPPQSHSHPHHHHHKRKKKHRNKQGASEASGEPGNIGDTGKDPCEGKTFGEAEGSTSTSSGDKENKGGGGGGPPRKIAQLVVWTKNPPSSSSTSVSASSSSKKPLKESRGALQNQQKSIGILVKNKSEEKEEVEPEKKVEITRENALITISSGGGEEEAAPQQPPQSESDLFIVQYPARPFSDQGKGKGKPFRRLNSYNDPIVIKKTPPAPPPSTRRRGGGGQKRKRVSGGHREGGGPSKEKPVGGRGVVVQLPLLPPPPIVAALEQEGVLVEVGGGGAGEIPIYLEPGQEHQYAALLQQIFLQNNYYTVPQGVGVGGEVYLHHHQHQLHPQGIVGEVIIPQSGVGGGERQGQVIKQETGDKSDPPVILLQGQGDNQASMGPVPPGGGGGVGEMGGGEYTIFDLPERFTVTTTSGEVTQNEFDLLIQNVVHEEMVMEAGGGQILGEGEMAADFGGEHQEGQRKRMRLDYEGHHANANGGSPPGGMGMGNNGEGCMSHGGEGDDGSGQGGGCAGGPDEPGKPRCTYTELIEKALTESGGLTVSEIYNWISERFPYYRQDDDRWKNSVRHNLSINPYFKKGEKARSGAGHLWTISEESKALRPSPHQQMVSWDEYQRRKNGCEEDDILLSMDNGTETDRAVASILGMYRNECNKAAEKEKGGNDTSTRPTLQDSQPLSDPLEEESSAVNTTTEQACIQIEEAAVAAGEEESSSCSTTTATATFGLEGQFTVDLSGITIPEGGTINFEELVSNGRLIYIQTTTSNDPPVGGGAVAVAVDPEANKENEQQTLGGSSGGQQQQIQQQLLSLNSDNQILAELTSSLPTSSQANGGASGGGSLVGGMSSEEAHRFSQSFYTDALGSLVADFGGFGGGSSKGESNGGGGLLMQSSSVFGGGNNEGYSSSACSTSTTVVPITSISCTSTSSCELTMVPPAEVVAPTTTADHNHRQHHHQHQDLTFLDHQVLHPLSTYEVLSSSTSACEHQTSSSLQLIGDTAALYESKELGLSYTTSYHQNSETLSSSSSADNHNHHNHQDLLH